MRVLITGSRTWSRLDVVWGSLDAFAEQAATLTERRLIVVHGAAYPKERRDGTRPDESADWLAHLWCEEVAGWWDNEGLAVVETPCPAKWSQCAPSCPRTQEHRKWKGGRSFCPRAGHRRNQAMADAGADVCIAFWRDGSPGTKGMIRIAEGAGIPTQVIDWADLKEKADA